MSSLMITYLLTYLLTHLCTYSVMYLLTYLLTHLFTYLLMYLLTHLLTYGKKLINTHYSQLYHIMYNVMRSVQTEGNDGLWNIPCSSHITLLQKYSIRM